MSGLREPLFQPLDAEADRSLAAEVAADDLRLHLPDLRQRPGCPSGDDEAILAMSYPP